MSYRNPPFHRKGQSTLWVCQLSVAAENDVVEIRRQTTPNCRQITVVGGQVHFAKIVVWQALGIVPNLVAVEIFIPIIRMRHNRQVILSQGGVFPEIVGFNRPLPAQDRCSFCSYAF